MNKNILFIGANGYMGHGMSQNLLKNNKLYVLANKQRNNIENLITNGAIEIKSYEEITNLNLDCLMLCVTDTPIALRIAKEVGPLLDNSTLVIDLTTHNKNGTKEMKNIFDKFKISFVVSPVMGSKNESLKGVLGSLWGGDQNKFEESKIYLDTFCENIFNFGSVEKACAAKLLSNFLSLLTTTTVIEYFKSAKKLDVDWRKLFEAAKLGSGNSGALGRIAEKAISGDYKGYTFSVSNTLKDLTYINDLLKDLPNAEKFSSIAKTFYEESVERGHGDSLISELIDKEKY
jgi:3-hydroxyisobutyrate dehydrogenase-like beta-hydroxyacid dehydrogenase